MARQRKKYCLTPEQQQLVADNINLAYWMTYKVTGTRLSGYLRMDADDWIMIFFEVLCVTATAYTPGKGKFSTLFAVSARQAIGKEIQCSQYQCRKMQLHTVSYDATSDPEREHKSVWNLALKSNVPDILESLVDETEVERILRIADTLPEDRRAAFLSVYRDGKTMSETGKEMGVSRSWVSLMLKEAQRKIQERLKVEDQVFDRKIRR